MMLGVTGCYGTSGEPGAELSGEHEFEVPQKLTIYLLVIYKIRHRKSGKQSIDQNKT